MRIPVPKNRLVALTLVGALLAGTLTIGLMSPSLLPGANDRTDASGSQQLGADAPTPNANFTPAVQSGANGGEHEREGDEHESDEREGGDD